MTERAPWQRGGNRKCRSQESFEERLAGADSFVVLRRGKEIGLRRIGTGGVLDVTPPAQRPKGGVFQFVDASEA